MWTTGKKLKGTHQRIRPKIISKINQVENVQEKLSRKHWVGNRRYNQKLAITLTSLLSMENHIRWGEQQLGNGQPDNEEE